MVSKYLCGLDFGTSNSVICAIPQTPGEPPVVISEPTVLFFPERKTSEKFVYYVGKDAVSAYLASGMRGRFIQSIKSILHDPDFDMTMIFGVPFTPVELVSLIITNLKQKMEETLGTTLDTVVMGRPVMFSSVPEEDALAQQRIEYAAMTCGFKSISFQLEPIGAAFAYEAQLKKQQTVLVVDLGGGTTDFTIMNLDPSYNAQRGRKQDILAIGGVHIGGDDFDSRIMWNRLIDQFGYGSQYSEMGKLYDFPIHFFTTLCTWHEIAKLKEHPFKEDLRIIYRASTNKPAVEKLKALIEHDLGFALYKSIEKAKMDFSDHDDSTILFKSEHLTVDAPVCREAFEEYISEDVLEIDQALSDTLAQADLEPSQIDSVLMTGGSSLVRAIQAVVVARFGEEKLIKDANRFTSVAVGLALGAGMTKNVSQSS